VIERSRGLIERLGNPLDWPSPAKVLFVTAFVVPPLLALHLRARVLVGDPLAEPYVSRDLLGDLLTASGWILEFLAASAALSTWMLRTRRESRAFVHVVMQGWWLIFGWGAYIHGPATTPLLLLFPVLALGTMILFGIKTAVPGMLTGAALVLGTTAAERFGYLPYAPYFEALFPVADGAVASEWIVSMTAFATFSSAALIAESAYILHRWRVQSDRIAEMAEVLKLMFGRYMSTEVMKTLLEDPSAMQLGGSRRRVTMMLTDLRGFSALAERLSPEAVLSLLNGYFEVMVDVCLRYHGTMNEITGDALLVTFGAPQEMEDAAAVAVACAIDMQNAMVHVNEDNAIHQRPQLQMGIGIHADEVIIGNIGSEKRSKFGIVGSAVNMTSRIESYTVGDEVLVSQAIVDEVGERLRVDGSRQIAPKGFSEPITVYKVGGIAGGYNLALELTDEPAAPLSQGVEASWVRLSGKQLEGADVQGAITAVSRTGLRFEPATGLRLMDDVRLNLTKGSTYITRSDIYAKVSALEDGSATLRFTSVPPEILAYFEGLRS
jgi:class 3 adenylate cyclase